MERKW